MYSPPRAEPRPQEAPKPQPFGAVLFSLQLSVCLGWRDYRSSGFPTPKFGVVMADPLAIC